MGRPERPIDPAAGAVPEFAAELRKLRERAGRPSYRELARRASYSVTVLSEAAGGRCLPTLAVVRGYVLACGGDVREWEERWRHAADLQRDEPDGEARPAPYLGLASYGQEHAGLFFGREALTGEVLRRLAARRFLAVFGASGSGKSSLLRAGVMTAVNRGCPHAAREWITVLLTPGEQPVTVLADRIAALAGTSAESLHDDLLTQPAVLHTALTQALSGLPAGAELLLIVDQFEELFSSCRDPLQRDCFVHALLAAATADDARARVVLGVRADFYGHCARWPALVTALRDAQVLVGPMDLDQMREVIVKPAEQAGMTVEGALVATALAEIDTETGIEPGALALLSHALLETWRHSPAGRLTLRAYQDAGGVRNAVAATAERVYADCPEDHRLVLRRILLRLVAVGDGAPDTRRRVPPAEVAAGDDPATTAALTETLVLARLVTIDDGSVQLAHEALIRFWPRLAEWLDEGRDGLRVERRLSDAACEWVRLGRDPAALYRGAPLAVARSWADQDAGLTGLTSVEQEFLDASNTAEATSRTAMIRAARRLRRLVAALAVLLTAVTAAGAVAGWQRETALSAERAAISGQLAEQSAALAQADSVAAVLAALASWHDQPAVASRSALLSIAACCTSTQTTLPGDDAGVTAVALSPGGKLLAAGGRDGVVHVWQTASGSQRILREPAGSVDAVAFTPSGDMLAVGSADGTIRLWNLDTGAVIDVPTGAAGAIESLAFSPDGLLASASGDGQARLWKLAGHPAGQGQGLVPVQVLPRIGKTMQALAFSPDGGLLAAAGSGGNVTVWSLARPQHASIVRTLHGATEAITNLAYNPTGTMIAAEESSGDVLLWQQNRRDPMLLPPACSAASGTDVSRGLAFSRDGTSLLVPRYGKLGLCDTRSGQEIADVPYQTAGTVTALAYDPGSGSLALGTPVGSVRYWQRPVLPFTGTADDGIRLAVIPGTATVASVSEDGTLSLWDDDGDLNLGTKLSGTPRALTASPDGKLLAVAASDRSITVLSLPKLKQVLRLPPPVSAKTPTPDVSFSPDGRLLAEPVGGTVFVWDATTWTLRLKLQVSGHTGPIGAIAFRPGGRILAASTSTGAVIEWNTRTGQQVAVDHQGPGVVNALAFSPGGQLLATADGEGTITLWGTAGLHPLGTLPGDAQPVSALAFSPDGRTLASGTDDGSIRVWDLTDRSLTATLTSKGEVHTLAFAPDGTTLLSGDASGIIAWVLDPGDIIRQACRMLADDPGLGQAETLVPNASYASVCP